MLILGRGLGFVLRKGQFPVDFFDHYYNDPNDLSVQPQPIIKDPITHVVYRMNLTSPDEVPTINLRDPISFPPISLRGAEADRLAKEVKDQIISIINSNQPSISSCEKCQKSLKIASHLSKRAPQLIPMLAIELCEEFKFKKDCVDQFGLHSQGPIISQVLSFANLGNHLGNNGTGKDDGIDGQYICYNFFSKSNCSIPTPTNLNLTYFFSKPKPKPQPKHQQIKLDQDIDQKKKRRLKVLHFSDFHLDIRYSTGSEANCSKTSMCCRMPIRKSNDHNLSDDNQFHLSAPRFGYFQCDTPISLGMAVVQAIPVLTGTNVKDGNGFDFSIYTGDLVAHDNTNYSQTELGGGPLYAAIGNHDSYLQAQDAPHSMMPERLSKQFSWNYDHLSRLWFHNHWISDDVAKIARAHYGGYAVKRYEGLKIITLNTDLWYRANLFNFINMTNPDQSGMLKFLSEELQKSEDLGQSVWIMGHVLSGWDGSNPLVNPTNLFYQIVERYSPHVIKAIMWGHTHEDQFMIYYANNATNITADHALTTGWVGPSITPLTNVNSGFRMYEVDPDTYEILDAHTWYSNVSTYSHLDTDPHKGPTYEYEYSTREAYGKEIKWPIDAPLNATWWHLVTEQMLKDNGTLISKFTKYQGKNSVRSPSCTSEECIKNKVCYMRSGSASIAKEYCKMGYGSVQGGK
ncbi:uncharacterized protein MELLADRAFT_35173 [Melampsora larici-populina 98AG31]|uniref:Calcineurin-like phosphoesterase domain-containing protein n=1 Tax=Melampsora larici-populina (strain 98AG31 / pathotype 3-4-7) TaxID=747676 RepID=F4RHW7_MELLP|nr:uncharacterized protein MELLADRAFT_35173 [Melampsora larici-populina 98AG31]EGG08061.1 hypothetical protein MELLADRAFT_35173 [Melampsora larici-populina 98AG31]